MKNDDLTSAFRTRPQLSIAGTESPLEEHVQKLEAAEADFKAAKVAKENAALALFEAMSELGCEKWRYTGSDGKRKVCEVKRSTKVVLRNAGPDDVEAS